MSNKFENKKVEVRGTEYLIQKIPTREAIRLRQQWQEGGVVDDEKMIDLCLEHFVISPKKKMEDFDSIVELQELVQECISFVYLGK
ncbi:hypothetical protein [Peptoniphilus senegalensis]|uniref:Phage protein n=1 Tax=Peptoniphilus senegalensis TaxID=1465757 RepID=A0ABV1J349_9FIRM